MINKDYVRDYVMGGTAGLLLLLIIVGIIWGNSLTAKADTPAGQTWSQLGDEQHGYLWRIVDNDFGVVCYMTGRGEGAGVACVKAK